MRVPAGHLGMKKGTFCALKYFAFKIKSLFDGWFFYLVPAVVLVKTAFYFVNK